MNKLDMAHDWAMKSFLTDGFKDEAEQATCAWQYADAMQAEAERREDKTRPEVLLTKDNDGKCLHLHHEFDHKKCMDCGASLEEWQPDWSQAPEWANWWAMDGFSEKANWYIDKPYLDDDSEVESEWNIDLRANAKTYIHAPSFGYQEIGENHFEATTMKRTKKYNPNKVSQLIQSKSMQVHRLWMRYDNDLIDRITDEWLKDHPDEDVATKLLYPHIEGDLIIAIKHRLISLEQKWHIKLTLELDDGTEAELIFDLPKAHLKDIKMQTAEFKIDRGNGIKTRWKGLDKEVEDAIKPLEAEGVSCIRTWAYIAVETPFKSKADYSYFVQEKALRLMLGEMVAA